MAKFLSYPIIYTYDSEAEQDKLLVNIYSATIPKRYAKGTTPKECLETTEKAMERFPESLRIQERGYSILANIALNKNASCCGSATLQKWVERAFNALMEFNSVRGIFQNVARFLEGVSLNDPAALFKCEASLRTVMLCNSLFTYPADREIQGSFLSVLIRSCEDPAICSAVRKFFLEQQDLPGIITSIFNVSITEKDSGLLYLAVTFVQALADEPEFMAALARGGTLASVLVSVLAFTWAQKALVTKTLCFLLTLSESWKPGADVRPSDLAAAENAVIYVISKYPTDERIQEWGCVVLEGLYYCCDCRSGISGVSSPERAAAFVGALRANEENPSVLKAYFGMLWNAAHNNDSCKLELGNAGAVSAVTDAMKAHSADAELQVQGCGLLASLLSLKINAEKAVRLKCTCGLSQVIYAIKKFSYDPSVQAAGMEVLCNVVACNPEFLFVCESMKIAVLNMYKMCENSCVVSKSLNLLRNMTFQGPLDQQFICFGGLAAVIGAARMDHLSSVRPLALSVLNVSLESELCLKTFMATWPGFLPSLLARVEDSNSIAIPALNCIFKVLKSTGVITKLTVERIVNVFRNCMDDYDTAYLCCSIFEFLAGFDLFICLPSKAPAQELMASAADKWSKSEDLCTIVNKFICKVTRYDQVDDPNGCSSDNNDDNESENDVSDFTLDVTASET